MKFRSDIRQYNMALSFTSLGADIDHALMGGSGGPLCSNSMVPCTIGVALFCLLQTRALNMPNSTSGMLLWQRGQAG